MNLPPHGTPRTMVTTGTLSSQKIRNLASTYPFSQQLDVLLTTPHNSSTDASFAEVLNSLQNLSASYTRCKIGLWFFVQFAMSIFDRYSHDSTIVFSALPLPSPLSTDTWCIDPHGNLTLQVSKETYEKLGLVGCKLPFKFRGAPEQYIIRIPLQNQLETSKNRERQKAALQAWDQLRIEGSIGDWDILFNCSTEEHGFGHAHVSETIKPQVTRRVQVHIPTPSITAFPSGDEDAIEEWEEEMSELYEWVGLACLGSQRLDVQDRVDPYVSVYSPPARFTIGDTVHLRWTGLLSPAFIQSVINILAEHDIPFASIISHCPFNSPVSYLPPRPKTPPTRVISEDAETTWSMVFVHRRERGYSSGPENQESGVREGKWALAETAGKWDMRWG